MIMKKNLFFAAMAIVLASCASDDFVGENNNSPNVPTNDSQITFGLGVNRMTRAAISGSAAAYGRLFQCFCQGEQDGGDIQRL